MVTRFVFFDLGNVLIRFSLERLLKQVSEVFQVSPDEIAGFYLNNFRIQKDFESGKIDTDAYYERICNHFGQKPLKIELFLAINDIFWPNEGMLPIVAGLRKIDFPCGILSNVGPLHWNHCRTTFPEIMELIPNHHVLSFEVQALKPEREIYEAALEIAQKSVPDLAPGEILFIDDLTQNVEAAREFGFDAVTFTGRDALKKVFIERDLPLF